MPIPATECLLRSHGEHHAIEHYQSDVVPRWCTGCGNSGILTAVQRLCRDEGLVREKTVFVSGIGCSSRFPHYMKTYGFHGAHGRALPIAEGIKMTRPDLDVFVITGDGDCCSIGTAHWIHAVRYNMDMTLLLHDNQVFGLTKNQASPTSPRGLKSNTTPRGSYLEPLNPLSVTLGIANVSFVAQAADWIPELLYAIIARAYRHKGLSVVRVLQRCPEFVANVFDPLVQDPDSVLLLEHDDGIRPSASLAKVYAHREEHDPSGLDRAREIASITDRIPVGVLYRNADALRYDEIRGGRRLFTPEMVEAGLEREFDKFTVWPEG